MAHFHSLRTIPSLIAFNPGSSNFQTSNYAGGGYFDYESFINSKEIQKEMDGRINLFTSFYDQTNSSIYYKRFSISNSINLESIHRKYFKDKYYFEFNTELDSRLSISKRTDVVNNQSTNRDLNSIDAFIFLPFKIGKGRIDNISDARQAIYMLEAFKEKGILDHDPSALEFTALADEISRIKNRRYFDFRLRRIYELERLDSFLQSNNYIKDQNIRYFSTLNDMWVFGNNRTRFNGERIALAIYPGVDYIQTKGNTFGSVTKSNVFLLQGGVEYKNEKPHKSILAK